MDMKVVQTLDLKADSQDEFFLIHWYTWSPTDFNNLPYILHKEFSANVKIIKLVGHGTRVEDLDDVTYEDLVNQIDFELRKDLKDWKKIIIWGVSLWALLSLRFASIYPVYWVINICSTYKFKFPFNLKFLIYLKKYKKYWKKIRPRREKIKRLGSFSYDYMHINWLKIVNEAKNDLENRLQKVQSPILSIHSYADPIANFKSAYLTQNKVRSYIKKVKIFNWRTHNIFASHDPFFSVNSEEIYKEIVNFVKQNNLFYYRKKDKIAAIVPSFDEAKRIDKVLNTLTKVDIIDEIIVVDDWSTDNTQEVVEQYKKVRYTKNLINMWKAQSMEIWVKLTDADIIFFCDADLIWIKKEDVEEIIKPVLRWDYCMFIGIRWNLMQKTIHLFAINSWERALRRVVWEKLPSYFKYKYRVEAWLNHYVNRYYGWFGTKVFEYIQPVKESKYGLVRWTILRWWMNIDVLYVYLIDIILNLFRR